MRTSIVVKIDDASLKKAEFSRKEVLAYILQAISGVCETLNLDYDCGYNPELITDDNVN